MDNKAYLVANPMTPCKCVVIDPELCKGCYSCVNVCRTDVLVPNPEKGKPPIVLYPDECWFCGNCVEFCPTNCLSIDSRRILGGLPFSIWVSSFTSSGI